MSESMASELAASLAQANAENRQWRSVAAQMEGWDETPYELLSPGRLERDLFVLKNTIDVGERGFWGIYAIEALFDALEVEPGENSQDVVARIEGWKSGVRRG